MENEKDRQTELTENETVCPACGGDNAEQTEKEETAVEETAVEETAAAEAEEAAVPAEAAEAEENEAPGEQTAAAPGKKATPGKIALAVGAVVVLAAALIALIASGLGGNEEAAEETVSAETSVVETVAATVPADGNPDDVTCKGSYTVDDEAAVAAKSQIVATIADKQLTNGELQVYYWSMVNSYLNSEYGYYMMMYGVLDYTQPLDTQISIEQEDLTWQQYFLKEALNYWQMSVALAGEAEATGVEMSQEDREYLDNLAVSLEETAAAYGMTLEELLLNNIGPGAGLEEFAAFQKLYCEGKDFYQAALAEMVPTQEELEAFYAEHEEDYISSGITQDAKYVDARHILVGPKGGTTDENGVLTYSEEEWAACEQEAQAILDAFLSGDRTEESFAALATEKTEDAGSQTTGGLYENMYEGQMVEPFENWCFDESRVYGDTGLVRTDYGYHVMYFVKSEPVWLTYVESDWVTEQSGKFLEDLSAKYPMAVEYDSISLGYIDLGSV